MGRFELLTFGDAAAIKVWNKAWVKPRDLNRDMVPYKNTPAGVLLAIKARFEQRGKELLQKIEDAKVKETFVKQKIDSLESRIVVRLRGLVLHYVQHFDKAHNLLGVSMLGDEFVAPQPEVMGNFNFRRSTYRHPASRLRGAALVAHREEAQRLKNEEWFRANHTTTALYTGEIYNLANEAKQQKALERGLRKQARLARRAAIAAREAAEEAEMAASLPTEPVQRFGMFGHLQVAVLMNILRRPQWLPTKAQLLYADAWSISMKEKNRIAHALNGNQTTFGNCRFTARAEAIMFPPYAYNGYLFSPEVPLAQKLVIVNKINSDGDGPEHRGQHDTGCQNCRDYADKLFQHASSDITDLEDKADEAFKFIRRILNVWSIRTEALEASILGDSAPKWKIVDDSDKSELEEFLRQHPAKKGHSYDPRSPLNSGPSSPVPITPEPTKEQVCLFDIVACAVQRAVATGQSATYEKNFKRVSFDKFTYESFSGDRCQIALNGYDGTLKSKLVKTHLYSKDPEFNGRSYKTTIGDWLRTMINNPSTKTEFVANIRLQVRSQRKGQLGHVEVDNEGSVTVGQLLEQSWEAKYYATASPAQSPAFPGWYAQSSRQVKAFILDIIKSQGKEMVITKCQESAGAYLLERAMHCTGPCGFSSGGVFLGRNRPEETSELPEPFRAALQEVRETKCRIMTAYHICNTCRVPSPGCKPKKSKGCKYSHSLNINDEIVTSKTGRPWFCQSCRSKKSATPEGSTNAHAGYFGTINSNVKVSAHTGTSTKEPASTTMSKTSSVAAYDLLTSMNDQQLIDSLVKVRECDTYDKITELKVRNDAKPRLTFKVQDSGLNDSRYPEFRVEWYYRDYLPLVSWEDICKNDQLMRIRCESDDGLWAITVVQDFEGYVYRITVKAIKPGPYLFKTIDGCFTGRAKHRLTGETYVESDYPCGFDFFEEDFCVLGAGDRGDIGGGGVMLRGAFHLVPRIPEDEQFLSEIELKQMTKVESTPLTPTGATVTEEPVTVSVAETSEQKRLRYVLTEKFKSGQTVPEDGVDADLVDIYIRNGFSTFPSRSVWCKPTKDKNGNETYVPKPEDVTLTFKGWKKTYMVGDKEITPVNLEVEKKARREIKVKFEITEEAEDADKFARLSELYKRCFSQARREMFPLKKHTKEKVIYTPEQKAKMGSMARSKMTYVLNRSITPEHVGVHVKEATRLGTVSMLYGRMVQNTVKASGLDLKKHGLAQLRLENIEKFKSEGNFGQKLFANLVDSVKKAKTCDYSITHLGKEYKCGFVFCNGKCKEMLKKRAHWEATGGDKESYFGDGGSRVALTERQFLDKMIGFDEDKYVPMTPEQEEQFFAELHFFGFYFTGADMAAPMRTSDVLSAERFVDITAGRNKAAVDDNKQQKQLKAFTLRKENLQRQMDKLDKQMNKLEAKGLSKCDVNNPTVLEVADHWRDILRMAEDLQRTYLGENNVITAGSCVPSMADGGFTITEAVQKLISVIAATFSPDSKPVRVEPTPEELTGRLRATVKGIRNITPDGKQSDNLCWPHSYTYLKALETNKIANSPENLAKPVSEQVKPVDLENLQLLEPKGNVLADGGLKLETMIESYGLDENEVSFYLAQDSGDVKQGWYGSDPLNAKYQFYISDTGTPGNQLLHCEPIIDLVAEEFVEVSPMGLKAGNAGEGLVFMQPAQRVVDTAELEEKPQMDEIKSATKFSMPKTQLSTEIASVSSPFANMAIKYVSKYLEFSADFCQKIVKDGNTQFLFDNTIFNAPHRLFDDEANGGNELMNNAELDRITFFIPKQIPSLSDQNQFRLINVEDKFYNFNVDRTFVSTNGVDVMPVVSDLMPKAADAIMKVFQADTVYETLSEARADVSKLMTMLESVKSSPASTTAFAMGALYELFLRECSVDINMLSHVGGLIPNLQGLGGARFALDTIRPAYSYQHPDHPDVRLPRAFPLAKKLLGNGEQIDLVGNINFYNQHGATVPVAVVPQWFSHHYFSRAFFGKKNLPRLYRAAMRASRENGSGKFQGNGGFDREDVEDFLREKNQPFLTLPVYNAAGAPIGGQVQDALPLSVGQAFADWGIAPARHAGPGYDQAQTQAQWAQRWGSDISELVKIREKLTWSAQGGSGDLHREDAFKLGYLNYSLLDEFSDYTTVLPIVVDEVDLQRQEVLMAKIIASMPKPWFMTYKNVPVTTPKDGFTSYVGGQPVRVDAPTNPPVANVPFTNSVQTVTYDTGFRAIMICVAGKESENIDTNIDWFGGNNLRNGGAVPQGVPNFRALGINGNLNKYLLPLKVESWCSPNSLQIMHNIDLPANDPRRIQPPARGRLARCYPRNEGPGGRLWDVPQNMNFAVQRDYVNLSATTFLSTLCDFLESYTSLSELQSVQWQLAAVLGHSNPLPVHSTAGHHAYGYHTCADEARRARILGTNIRGATDLERNATTRHNTVTNTRADLVAAQQSLLNAIGMRSYHLNHQDEQPIPIAHKSRNFVLGVPRAVEIYGWDNKFLKSNTEAWDGAKLFESRTWCSNLRDASRRLTMVTDKLMDATGLCGADSIEFQHTANTMSKDDMLLRRHQEGQNGVHRAIEQFYTAMFPQRSYKTKFQACQYTQERVYSNTGALTDIRSGYQLSTLKRVPRPANFLYKAEDQPNYRRKFESTETERFTTPSGDVALRALPFEEGTSDSKVHLLSQLPWKYSTGNNHICELNKAGVFFYKSQLDNRYACVLQLSGTEDRIHSLEDILDPDLLGAYGLVDTQYAGNMKQFIRTAGYDMLLDEYRFSPIIPGNDRRFKLATTQANSIFAAHQGVKLVRNVQSSDPEIFGALTKTEEYVADYNSVARSHFTF
ncbi:putative coat protein [Rosellinia necatrix megatotivirus 1]|nr:putative coat protein [Rosellinia necatrix megatotivirus 1]